ncbi:hypothetical protein STEG23_010579, partial [Scotinomys teguina]
TQALMTEQRSTKVHYDYAKEFQTESNDIEGDFQNYEERVTLLKILFCTLYDLFDCVTFGATVERLVNR